MEKYFEIKNLAVSFNTFEGVKPVLNIEHIVIDRGETFGLVGESGAGKTVLALTILGLLPPHSAIIHHGHIWFDGEDLLQKSQKQLQDHIRGKRISMIFQDPMSTLNPVFSVGEQLGRVIERHQNIKGSQTRKRALEMLDLVKLPDASDMLRKYPHELSGGQRQRVIIAIALSCGAEFLIADEPTRNLDVTIQAGIMKLIDELQDELSISVLFIANNMGLVNVICDFVGILYRGRVVEMGASAQVIRQPAHPYTVTLLSAIPRSKSESLRFAKTDFRPDVDAGCPYYARCPLAIDNCRDGIPPLRNFGGRQQVACIRAKEGVML